MTRTPMTRLALAAGLALAVALPGVAEDKPMTGKPDAQMQAVLDQFAALDGKPITECTPQEARKQPSPTDAVKALLKKQGKSTDPEAVGSVKDVSYPAAAGTQPARVYTPKGDGPFPVLAYWHGGGWVLADLDTYDASCRALCNAAGCIVVSLEYRHAPEFPFPAAADDAYAGYQYVLKNAATMNGDSKKVAVAGESAGGNLAAVTTLRARDTGLQLPLAQVLVYPVTNNDLDTPSYLKNADAKPLNKPMMKWFFAHYVGNQAATGANPVAFPMRAVNLTKLPPTTIINAEIDPLLDDGVKYAAKLKAAGVTVTQQTFPGVAHEFFGMGAVVDKSKEAVKVAADALKLAYGK